MIKKTCSVSEAIGWYLTQDANRSCVEDVLNEETGVVTQEERQEKVCWRGAQVDELTASMLTSNGIETVSVSNICLIGEQVTSLNLWEATMRVHSKVSSRKECYIVTADSPAAAEAFISSYLEVNVDVRFELIKVSKLNYGRVIKIYDAEIEKLTGKPGWYKVQVFSSIDGDDGGEKENSRTALVQAISLERAVDAVKTVMGRNEFDGAFTLFKLVQEQNIVDVFTPDENVNYYSNEEL